MSAIEKLGQDWDAAPNHGIESLQKQVLTFLEKNMQSLHFSISQRATNMNKIAGTFSFLTTLSQGVMPAIHLGNSVFSELSTESSKVRFNQKSLFEVSKLPFFFRKRHPYFLCIIYKVRVQY